MAITDMEDRISAEMSNGTGGINSPAMGPNVEIIQEWLVTQLAHELKVEAHQIDVREPFANYGLDSIAAVGLSGDLEDWLERPFPDTLLWDHPTIEVLARHLAADVATQ